MVACSLEVLVLMGHGIMDAGREFLIASLLLGPTPHGHLYNRLLLTAKQLHYLSKQAATYHQVKVASSLVTDLILVVVSKISKYTDCQHCYEHN